MNNVDSSLWLITQPQQVWSFYEFLIMTNGNTLEIEAPLSGCVHVCLRVCVCDKERARESERERENEVESRRERRKSIYFLFYILKSIYYLFFPSSSPLPPYSLPRPPPPLPDHNREGGLNKLVCRSLGCSRCCIKLSVMVSASFLSLFSAWPLISL